MAAVQNAKNVAGFNNQPEIVRVVYDFAKDAGAVGQLDLLTAKVASIVKFAYARVITTCTSGGAATVSAGKAADLAGIIGATAVASLVADAIILGAAPDQSHVLAADAKIQMDIATAALTAGKIEFVFEVIKQA
jgi:hypothetical protein